MGRVQLLHWNADEAADRAERLKRAGHDVSCHSDKNGQALRKLREDPPEAFVIDLGRVPSHGGAVGTWLRQQKPTRQVPIVFVGGDPAKVAKIRRQMPDATYTEWARIRGALTRAIAKRPEKPVVPGTMDGYSGTPLPKKLGIRAEDTVALLGGPGRFEKTLGDLPDGVRLRRQARGILEVILLFAGSRADLNRRFSTAKRALAEGGRLWIAWPKKASGVATDLTQQHVREYGLARGLVDYKICSIDSTWSGLCFTRRRRR
jgi:CheY-like chemotaxis protein